MAFLLYYIFITIKSRSFFCFTTYPITIPKHEPIKTVYVEIVKQIVESEENNDENIE